MISVNPIRTSPESFCLRNDNIFMVFSIEIASLITFPYQILRLSVSNPVLYAFPYKTELTFSVSSQIRPIKPPPSSASWRIYLPYSAFSLLHSTFHILFSLLRNHLPRGTRTKTEIHAGIFIAFENGNGLMNVETTGIARTNAKL